METEATRTAPAPAGTLAELGAGIRQRRKQLRVSATAAAESAGLSRVTLHRIERGEPSVAMGLYQRATAALGLKLQLADALPAPLTRAHAPPAQLRLADLPELRRLAWQLDPATELTPRQALDLYERNWRHLDSAAMTPRERDVLDSLVHGVGGGRLLV
jgi:transcriptional regulator with XRE-family HTH domain